LCDAQTKKLLPLNGPKKEENILNINTSDVIYKKMLLEVL
jgi:hypothetical protein